MLFRARWRPIRCRRLAFLSVERHDVASNTWMAVADLLQGRSFFRAVTIGCTGPAEEQNCFDSLISKASERRESI
jgi:hypothetical protein